MSDDTLVIGDVHGYHDKLKALLTQEGLLSDTGGRLRPEVRVVQLGDLGHFGYDRHIQQPMGYGKITKDNDDAICYQMLAEDLIDVSLWGNHDRAVIEYNHHFGGYAPPSFRNTIDELRTRGKILLAAEAHGFFLTHAGLHSQFKNQKVPDVWKDNPALLAQALNDFDQSIERPKTDTDRQLFATIHAIGRHRGGPSPYGGIIWRDASESHYKGFRQIFGHTAKDKVRKYITPNGYSYCIDTITSKVGKLTGMWLPSERIVSSPSSSQSSSAS